MYPDTDLGKYKQAVQAAQAAVTTTTASRRRPRHTVRVAGKIFLSLSVLI